MSICAAVFTSNIDCPDNLKTFNKDGSRIDPAEEKNPRPQSELGSQGVLNATLNAAKAKQERLANASGSEKRSDSVDSGLSGDTLSNVENKGKKHGLFRKLLGHGDDEVQTTNTMKS